MPAWTQEFHPFYFWSFGIWLVLLVLRSLWWRYRPTARCETCAHVGKVHNKLRGSWLKELVWFVLFVPPGFLFIILLDVYFGYFLVRWFVVRECASCGSERLAYGKRITTPDT
jgi:hypothetical protein